jgi:hypothetical protein
MKTFTTALEAFNYANRIALQASSAVALHLEEIAGGGRPLACGTYCAAVIDVSKAILTSNRDLRTDYIDMLRHDNFPGHGELEVYFGVSHELLSA